MLYLIRSDIGPLEASPRFHFDENTFVFFDTVRVEDTFVFGQRESQTC